MKLQNMTVIFIIIMIPIFILVSYYMTLQIDTLNLQISYNTKLLNSTKDAVNAFEINTVEWNSAYSETADSKRRDIMGAVNTFVDSLANSMGMGGQNRKDILSYVPAIAFTLYDGYYIYSPAETKVYAADENGVAEKVPNIDNIQACNSFKAKYNIQPEESNVGQILYVSNLGGYTLDENDAKTTYLHVLKPFVTYSKRYVHGDIDVVINYTLDNYITVYGTIGHEYVIKSGYLINTNDSNINNINGELLKETIAWRDNEDDPYQVGLYNYIYTEDNNKVYNMQIENSYNYEYFTINSNGVRSKIQDTTGIVYRKYTFNNGNGINTIYQALCNGKINEGQDNEKIITKAKWYKDKNGNEYTGSNPRIDIVHDCSAMNYYAEAVAFTNWVYDNLGVLKVNDIQDIVASEEEEINYSNLNEILFSQDNIESEDSVFNIHKREVIKNSIINNLNEAITSYSRNNSNGEYYLPIFEETDWDQIYRNVSMVTFLQGIPIGLKKYNNYSIVTSTNNKEYVNPSEIYLIESDEYYHIDGCDKALINDISIAGYRNIDYKVQSYTEKEIVNGTEEKKVYNYYKHNNYNGTTKKACYYCIIQKELYNKSNDSNIVDVMHKAYIKALAREKYNNRKTRL